MNKKDFTGAYDTLREVSPYESDILESETYRQLLADAGVTPEDSRADGLKMRLAAETAKQAAEEAEKLTAAGAQERYSGILMRFLDGQFSARSAEERRAIVLEILNRVAELSGSPFTETENLSLSELDEDELEQELTRMLYHLTHKLLSKKAYLEEALEEDDEEDDEEDGWETGVPFSAGAAMGAGYYASESLRKTPEVIGAASGAASYLLQRDLYADEACAAEIAGIIMLTIGGVLILSVLEIAVISTYVSAVNGAITGTAAEILAAIGAKFKEAASMFSWELKLGAGAGAAGLLLQGVARALRKRQDQYGSASIQTAADTDDRTWNAPLFSPSEADVFAE